VQEAAKVGLYSFDFFANAMLGDPTGLTLPIALEELFWGDAGIGLSIFGSGLAAAGIAGMGTPEQVFEWTPQCFAYDEASGKIQIGAYCVSEPDAGSDVSSLRTRAEYDEAKDEWVINGTKAWITNGGIADIHVVVATVDPELKSRGQASFVIPPNTKGLSQGQKYKKHGIRASHTAEVVLDDVRVPGSHLLGGKEKLDHKLARAREAGHTGEKQPAMATFEATRPAVGAMAVGIARGAYEYALEYAKERKAFGKSVIQHQAIAFMLADMAVEIDASRLLVHRAAWLSRNGGYTNAEGSMSKLKAGRTAVWVTERAIQILGGYGYTREYPVERMHRDAKIYDIFEGTEQIQQLVISRAISGMRIE
jgi:alkylation response protein AidB-like acyl-CoA dehydrogenase